MTTISLGMLAGYAQGPFFWQGEGINWTVAEASEQLGLSAGLAHDLTVWDDQWQDTLDLADVDNCGFDTDEEKHAWIERGKVLAARIKQESSVVARVDYQANGYYPNGACVF
ncbi:hypothetical protein FHR81_005104 [Actinoalloteichus hoggarensis]|uniref:Uncharacterized protein n=1 Tax=Actinoalloteichus hoggarensis TaxID=1470176 RepID=A0A221WAV7_9PSEU|nr:hypothetical protein [Actinoalloteichus hoggarensis]ASO22831.1 hypothetical protein AHOG_26130 [Actinoalloteichus hoggarensis]MBB5924027.1 hypothetical protein [Actinoalloteichus hoggarensis]